MTSARRARSLRSRLASWIYVGIAIPSLVLGSIYLFRPTFMPYHAVALGREWAELDVATQALIKALMELAGGGWLALGASLLFLVAFPLRAGQRWARWAAPILSLLVYAPSFVATWNVFQATPATPPWHASLGVCIAAVLAFLLDAPWRRSA